MTHPNAAAYAAQTARAAAVRGIPLPDLVAELERLDPTTGYRTLTPTEHTERAVTLAATRTADALAAEVERLGGRATPRLD